MSLKEHLTDEYMKKNDPEFYEFIESMKDENGNIPLNEDNISNLNGLSFVNGYLNDYLPDDKKITWNRGK